MINLSYDVNIYRKQLKEIIKKDDVVVEIGSHTGNTSEIILKELKNGKLIALDNSPEAIEPMNNLKEKYNNFNFIKGDVRLHDILEEVYSKINKCDLLLIDMGGGYHPDTVFKVFYIWSATLKPENTLIRNRGLVEFINSSNTEENIKSNKGFFESYNDEGIPPQIKEFNLWTDKLK
ncbi:class I SAM-dependent methyltransferase [Methanobrevibacter sp. OttesenSCG-928-K11]|nr:class I SAM-dependent methyltransferase [Methanobrevibacter sp. OttesenSCG-928-K11]MDL2270535.1 class I SAM-dependent methyltransferase [Methanobrevibacter sp. OttesenSCG-928-I08]